MVAAMMMLGMVGVVDGTIVFVIDLSLSWRGD
jgi:hypothetical protein